MLELLIKRALAFKLLRPPKAAKRLSFSPPGRRLGGHERGQERGQGRRARKESKEGEQERRTKNKKGEIYERKKVARAWRVNWL